MDENTTMMVELDEDMEQRIREEADAQGVPFNDVLLKYLMRGLEMDAQEE
ncbi:hypothetical protein ACMT4L_17015 [Deinococcus sp. A31D244]